MPFGLFPFLMDDIVVADISPDLAPDPEQMRRHVEHLFGGWLDGCHEGRIELAWTDAARRQAAAMPRLFGTDELDELVERAVSENRVPGPERLCRPGPAPARRRPVRPLRR